jgi:hypothetical protein
MRIIILSPPLPLFSLSSSLVLLSPPFCLPHYFRYWMSSSLVSSHFLCFCMPFLCHYSALQHTVPARFLSLTSSLFLSCL